MTVQEFAQRLVNQLQRQAAALDDLILDGAPGYDPAYLKTKADTLRDAVELVRREAAIARRP